MLAARTTGPIRRVLYWQAMVTVAVAALAGGIFGLNAALSAVLGGLVNIAAVVVYAVVVTLSNPKSAAGTVAAVARAEAVKILVIILQLWLVLTTYRDVVPAAFFVTFVLTVLLFRMALFDRD